MRTGEEGRESGEQDKMIEMREDFKGKKDNSYGRKSAVTLERESKKYKDNYKYK